MQFEEVTLKSMLASSRTSQQEDSVVVDAHNDDAITDTEQDMWQPDDGVQTQRPYKRNIVAAHSAPETAMADCSMAYSAKGHRASKRQKQNQPAVHYAIAAHKSLDISKQDASVPSASTVIADIDELHDLEESTSQNSRDVSACMEDDAHLLDEVSEDSDQAESSEGDDGELNDFDDLDMLALLSQAQEITGLNEMS